MAELSKLIEQIAIPRITEEITVSFSESGARGYNFGPAFVFEEICLTFHSGSEKFLHLVASIFVPKYSGWLLDASEFCALPGRGIQCIINEKQVLVGNRSLLTESGVIAPTHAEKFVVELEESAKTGILVAYGSVFIGVLGVADPLKREAAVVVEGLLKMGVRPVMVIGDNWRTAQAVAKEENVDEVTCLAFVGESRI